MTSNLLLWLLAAGVIGFTAWTFRSLLRDEDRQRAIWLAKPEAQLRLRCGFSRMRPGTQVPPKGWFSAMV